MNTQTNKPTRYGNPLWSCAHDHGDNGVCIYCGHSSASVASDSPNQSNETRATKGELLEAVAILAEATIISALMEQVLQDRIEKLFQLNVTSD